MMPRVDPPVKPPPPISASDTRLFQAPDSLAARPAYTSMISNIGGASGLTKPANTAKTSLIGGG